MVSIIAVLFSILLPALQHAKRQVKVLECTANLRSIGLGIAGYVSENDGGTNKFGFCPLYAWTRLGDILLIYNDPNIPFAKHFGDPRIVTPQTGFFISFIIIAGNAHSGLGGNIRWDWSHSGNPNGRWFPGASTAVSIVANNGWIESLPISAVDIKKPDCPAQTGCGLGFKESNSLWSDDHVETRTTPENYIFRIGPPSPTVY